MTYIEIVRKQRTTVVETTAFAARAKGRMTGLEIEQAVEMIARDPLCGDVIQGTGGIRKVRLAAKGKGKSGGVRIVYYYYNETMPVFLLTMFAKNEKVDLTKAERNALAKVARALRESYGE